MRVLTVNGSRIDSRELFAAEREIIIAHGEDNYRLRLTSQNKLIPDQVNLTKRTYR